MTRSPPGRGEILVVEADEPVRKLVQILLESSGFRVVAVADAASAIAACASRAFDMALVDVGLDREEGARLVERIRRCRPRLRVLVMGTGVGSVGSDFAPASFLQKPFTRGDLLSAVRSEMEAGPHGDP